MSSCNNARLRRETAIIVRVLTARRNEPRARSNSPSPRWGNPRPFNVDAMHFPSFTTFDTLSGIRQTIWPRVRDYVLPLADRKLRFNGRGLQPAT
jgi:hypothetical protein